MLFQNKKFQKTVIAIIASVMILTMVISIFASAF